MMKGQIYLITAVFIVIMLVFLRVGTMSTSDLQKDVFYDDIRDLKEEYIHIVDVSILNSENITDNLDDFFSFTKDYYGQKSINHTVLYDVSQTSSNATVNFYIYLGNDKSYLSDEFRIERSVY